MWQVASGDPHSLTSFSCLKYSYQSPQHPLSPARAPQRRPQGPKRSFGMDLPPSTFGRRKGQNRTVRLSRRRCCSFQFGPKGSSKLVTPPLPSLVRLFLTFVLRASVYTVKIRSSCGKGRRNWEWVRGGAKSHHKVLRDNTQAPRNPPSGFNYRRPAGCSRCSWVKSSGSLSPTRSNMRFPISKVQQLFLGKT